MKEELIQKLGEITGEEEKLRKGQKLNKKLYTSMSDFVVDSKKVLSYDKMIDIRPHTRFTDFPKHKHNYIEIIYMAKGKTVHCIQDKVTVELFAGDLLFLNQHVTHSINASGEDDIGINFLVKPEFFDLAFDMLPEKNELKSFLAETLTNGDGHAAYLHYHVADVLPVQNLIENLVWSILNIKNDKHNLNPITMALLMLELLNCTDRLEHHDREQYENTIVMNALHYIEFNYREASLSELADREDISIYQLSRYIKNQTGHGFKELLQNKRINKAVQLLSETNIPVFDIITYVGYNNSSYFFRIFKEKYNMSPKKYRELYGKKE